MVEEEKGEPLRLMNTAKIHSHVEQFLLEMNWRLGERLLYNQGYKKYPHEIQQEEKCQVRPVALVGDSE